jgi:chromosomal replication initiation ATPase DnaA
MTNFIMNNQEETLIRIVEDACNLTIDEIRSTSRRPHLVIARSILAVMLKTECGCTCYRAGELVGRDHSSVVAYERNFNENIEFYKKYRETYNAIKEQHNDQYSDISMNIMSKQIFQIERQLEILKARQLLLTKKS